MDKDTSEVPTLVDVYCGDARFQPELSSEHWDPVVTNPQRLPLPRGPHVDVSPLTVVAEPAHGYFLLFVLDAPKRASVVRDSSSGKVYDVLSWVRNTPKSRVTQMRVREVVGV